MSADTRHLYLAKLRALIQGSQFAARPWQTVEYGPGVGLIDPDTASVLLYPSVPDVRSLGAALTWASRRDVGHIGLLVDAVPVTGAAATSPRPRAGARTTTPTTPVDNLAGHLARRATYFREPTVTVYTAVLSDAGGELVEQAPASTPTLDEPLPSPQDRPAIEALAAAEVEVVVEGGQLRGEVNGLEVARLLAEPNSEGSRLEVGVGQADRELTSYVHAGAEPAEEVARVAQAVREHRRPDAPRHPLNQLVLERWLRAVVLRHPERLGLAALVPVAGWPVRTGLNEVAPALAVGVAADGTPVTVAFSVGVDPDLVPYAADARQRLFPDDDAAALWLVMPERDALAPTRALAAGLGREARVHTVPDDWRRW